MFRNNWKFQLRQYILKNSRTGFVHYFLQGKKGVGPQVGKSMLISVIGGCVGLCRMAMLDVPDTID